jgi:TetR/AcrR family transcriptional repressor of lmrAB and yxaGH operons
MIDTTLRLLRRQGFKATGMAQIIEESGAPRGSIYHHFPGGKEELALAALRAAGEVVAGKIEAALDGHNGVIPAMRAYIEAYADEIRQSDYERGCPVGNVAMDAAATSPTIRKACEEIFNSWEALIAGGLVHDGFAKGEAGALAEFILSSLEGALILCRARRSTEPLDRVAKRIEAVVSSSKRKHSARGARRR